MRKYNFKGKKIGVWGAGIVGKSAITFFQQENVILQLLNKEIISDLDSSIQQLKQTPENIKLFFENNDYIMPSPGIPLHNYSQYYHKIITEVDILQDRYKKPIIAITGTAGKTTVTHLLQKIFNTSRPTIAAGNIGHPMLNLLTKDHGEKLAVIELSSFQLQHAKQFAPDFAIITNLFSNHLDYHKSKDEYKNAKINIFKNQSLDQKKLLPYSLLSSLKIENGNDLFTFELDTITKGRSRCYRIENNKIIFEDPLKKYELCDVKQLPTYTFPENWLIIMATLHLNNIVINNALCETLHNFTLPNHRLAPIQTINGSTFYNDSKSTIWQSTAQAIDQVPKPISLFLGGLSKNVDRTPLIKKIKKSQDITVFAFGKEAEQIQQLCKNEGIPTFQATTLEKSFQQCIQNIIKPCSILFSPGGSSFDLFKNFKERGQFFEQLVKDLSATTEI